MISQVNGAALQAEINQSSTKATSMANSLNQIAAKGSDEELLSACQDFEAYFIQTMYKQMRSSTESMNSDGLFKKGNAEKIFTDMLDEEVARSAANSGGMGLAGFLYKQLKRDEVATAVDPTGDPSVFGPLIPIDEEKTNE